jgi:Topoisomerase VI B subunit, transducer
MSHSDWGLQGGSDVITKTALKRINWNLYKINQTTDKVGVFVSIVSTKIPYKGAGKEYIGEHPLSHFPCAVQGGDNAPAGCSHYSLNKFDMLHVSILYITYAGKILHFDITHHVHW